MKLTYFANIDTRLRHSVGHTSVPTRAPNLGTVVLKLLTVAIVGAISLSGCVTTQPQPDGSTKVHLTLGGSNQELAQPSTIPTGRPTPMAEAAKPERPNPVNAPSIRTTALAGLFAKHPYDGTSKTYFPRVAVTVTDWTRSDCWTATATVWRSKSKSETVQPFSVCWGQSVGYAVNNAANLHLFMEQMAVEHSGNVRTDGPKPPMLAIPDRQPFGERQQLAFQGFIQQLVLDTGWQPGAPTNFWLVGYDATAANSAEAPRSSGKESSQPMDDKIRIQLEQALACSAVGNRFDQVEAALKRAGWRPDQGITPVVLTEPVKVLGLSTRKIAVARDGFEHTYSSFYPGVSLQQVVKAAALKLGKDGKSYGRVTKLGVLTVESQRGETTLTCTANTESVED